MLIRKSLIMFLFLLVGISFVSASVTVNPSQLKIGESMTITIDFESYGNYIYFYKQFETDPMNYVHMLDLNCGDESCYGEKTFVYTISDDIFGIGMYLLFVHSFEDDVWFDYWFEVVAEEVPCIDSDVTEEYPDGKNYFVKGYVESGENIFEDYCYGDESNYLGEYFCEGAETSTKWNYECPNGCEDGACIKKEDFCYPSPSSFGYCDVEYMDFCETLECSECDDCLSSCIAECGENGLNVNYCTSSYCACATSSDCLALPEPELCEDDTLLEQCSVSKPKYCDNSGTLIHDCQTCGCPTGYNCQDDGACIEEDVEEPVEETCTLNEKKCSGDDLQLCNLNKEWITLHTCTGNFYCHGDSCKQCPMEEGIAPYYYFEEKTGNCNSDIEGCETDLLTNDNNCGECGNTCSFTNTCKQGHCVHPDDMCEDAYDTTHYGECARDNTQKYCNYNGAFVNHCRLCGCPEYYECITPPGAGSYQCVVSSAVSLEFPSIGVNTKAPFYSDKEVFLVSDKDWKDVLPFVPVAVWTEESSIKKYPTLVYHAEYTRFDADSIIYFMQQYSPDKVSIIGETPQELDDLLIASPDLGAGLQTENIQRINVDDYLFYWESFEDVVYVEENYELALLSSTYASLINAPLIIQGTTYDSPDIFSGRNIICVGSVSPAGSSCSETYNLEQLQQKYKDETNTDKIILVNPDDWTSVVYTYFPTDKSGNIYHLYTKTSLIAPILASAKHELILSTDKTDYEGIDSFLETRLTGINYLTIMAASNVVPHERYRTTDYSWALDSSHYADVTGDYKPDVAVGRIAGISNSDVSSYVARDLFYDYFEKTNNIKFMASSFYGVLAMLADRTSGIFKEAGYNSVSVTSDEESYQFDSIEWENQDVIYYADHGSSNWAGIFYQDKNYGGVDYEGIPELKNSLVVVVACSTASTYDKSSFWAHSIRKGAIGFTGAVGKTFLSTNYEAFLQNIYYSDYPTIGDAFKDSFDPSLNRGMATLIGDPTLDINPEYLLQEPSLIIELECQELGEGCCDFGAGICGELGFSCCPNFKCTGGKCTMCEGTDTSCGVEECVDCTAIEPFNYCKLFTEEVWVQHKVCVGNDCHLDLFNPELVENCELRDAVDLECNALGTKVKGYYFKCDDGACVKRTLRDQVGEDCEYGCTTGDCDVCLGSGTAVNTFGNPHRSDCCDSNENDKSDDYYCSVTGWTGICAEQKCAYAIMEGDCGTTPSPEYQCLGSEKQKRIHKGKGWDAGACYDNGWNDWTKVEDCDSEADIEYRCVLGKAQQRTHNGEGCSAGACYDNGWGKWVSTTTYICCIPYDSTCLIDSQCCSSEPCKMFSCGYQTNGEECLTDGDCEPGLPCKMLSCGCQTSSEGCLTNSDCCDGLVCVAPLTCRPCKTAGTVVYSIGIPHRSECCNGYYCSNERWWGCAEQKCN